MGNQYLRDLLCSTFEPHGNKPCKIHVPLANITYMHVHACM